MTFTQKKSLSTAEYAELVAEQFRIAVNVDSELVSIGDSSGRILTERLVAPENVPSFPNSQMDGYALTAVSCTRSERIFTVGADIAAGSVEEGLSPEDDVAYPIMTGAQVPAGLSAVVPEEKCEPQGERDGNFAAQGSTVRIPLTDPGSFVRMPGEDIRAGSVLAETGTIITPALLGALAAQGIVEVPVQERIRVLVVTGGDEIASESALGSSQIRDTNGPMLQALLIEDGAATRRLNISDNPHSLVERITEEWENFKPHLVVSSGGISHGKYEVVKNATALFESQSQEFSLAQSWFGHVQQQPGGPQGIITLETMQSDRRLLWLAFPGNPVSTLISYRLFLKPLLTTSQSAHVFTGSLMSNQPITGLADKTQYLRATVRTHTENNGTTRYHIYPDPQPGSHLLHRAATANALVEIEPQTTHRSGDTLRWYPLTSLDQI